MKNSIVLTKYMYRQIIGNNRNSNLNPNEYLVCDQCSIKLNASSSVMFGSMLGAGSQGKRFIVSGAGSIMK